mmetsp:Transcript_14080/g.32750  ORF Transcript_14080/g.32750 Transcript_14080/m.32750 type:complete len:103 (-) Transcript_14080:126-434(-)
MAKHTRSPAATAAAAGAPVTGAGAAQTNARGNAPPVAGVGTAAHFPGIIAPVAARTGTAAAGVGTVPPAIDGDPPAGAFPPVATVAVGTEVGSQRRYPTLNR